MSQTKIAKISTSTDKIQKNIINDMEFVSIQDEEFRTYQIPHEFGVHTLTIKEPQWLFVRPSGSHMVIDKEGYTHYIPKFVHLVWYNGSNTPANF